MFLKLEPRPSSAEKANMRETRPGLLKDRASTSVIPNRKSPITFDASENVGRAFMFCSLVIFQQLYFFGHFLHSCEVIGLDS